MSNLAILSRDADTYAEIIAGSSIENVNLVFQGEEADSVNWQQVDILLTEPDLALPVLPLCTNLKWLQSTWAGNKPLIDHSKSDYLLTGVKGIFNQQMREYVFAYLLYFERKISQFTSPAAENKLDHDAPFWSPPTIGKLANKKLGVIGAGSIASALIPVAKAFDMQITGLNLSGNNDAGFDKMHTLHSIEQFVEGLDYLVCILPDTPKTTHLIDAKFLAKLPAHCALINAGRGNAIDDKALVEALKANRIKAAVLDVFDQEPLPNSHEYWQLPNVIVTQHTAAISAPEAVAKVFIENWQLLHQGQQLNFLIDFQKGY